MADGSAPGAEDKLADLERDEKAGFGVDFDGKTPPSFVPSTSSKPPSTLSGVDKKDKDRDRDKLSRRPKGVF